MSLIIIAGYSSRIFLDMSRKQEESSLDSEFTLRHALTSMIGINSTKNTVALVRVVVSESKTLEILDSHAVDFSAESGTDLIELRDCLRALLKPWKAANAEESAAILKCSDGRMASSSSAFKAEGIVQMVVAELGISTDLVTPQSLPRGLKCKEGQKWQARAKELMNADGLVKHWTSKGTNGAAAAAYKVAMN